MTPTLTLDLTTAYANRKEPAANWEAGAGDFEGDVWPALKPGFSIAADETVFTIGSCFARNIEDNLAKLGCRVPMLDFELPPEEWHGRANGALNRFTPPTFRQAVEWVIVIDAAGGTVEWDRDCAPLAFEVGDDAFYDLDMVPSAPVSRDRFLQRRQHIFDVFRSVLSADCLMMTPGYIEAWRDLQTGLYLQGAPKHRRVIAASDRFRFELLSHEQCHADLLATIDLVRGHNPDVKVVITTSPVPLAVTFTGQDVRTANTYSKSVLRSVCGRIAIERDKVDYFPSYESAMLSFPRGVWQPDRQHVTAGFVGKIVQRLSDAYIQDVDAVAAAYQRAVTALRTHDAAASIAAANEALQSDSSHLGARLILAEGLMADDRWLEAEQILAPLWREEPGRPGIAVRLARTIIHLDKKRLPEALEIVRPAAALASADIKDLNWVVDLLRRRAKAHTEAEALARDMTVRFPLQVHAYQALIDLLLESGREQEASELLDRVLALPLPLARNWLQSAQLALKAGDLKKARNHAIMAERRGPREPGLRAFLDELEARSRASDPSSALPA
jgi:hypothetical protein